MNNNFKNKFHNKKYSLSAWTELDASNFLLEVDRLHNTICEKIENQTFPI